MFFLVIYDWIFLEIAVFGVARTVFISNSPNPTEPSQSHTTPVSDYHVAA